MANTHPNLDPFAAQQQYDELGRNFHHENSWAYIRGAQFGNMATTIEAYEVANPSNRWVIAKDIGQLELGYIGLWVPMPPVSPQGAVEELEGALERDVLVGATETPDGDYVGGWLYVYVEGCETYQAYENPEAGLNDKAAWEGGAYKVWFRVAGNGPVTADSRWAYAPYTADEWSNIG